MKRKDCSFRGSRNSILGIPIVGSCQYTSVAQVAQVAVLDVPVTAFCCKCLRLLVLGTVR